jgi:hypothetical protein
MSDLDNKEIEKINKILEKLYEEDNELFKKIMKLEDFINSKRFMEISKEQANLLEIQFQSMRTYHQTLRGRINNFTNEIWKIKEKK